MKNVSSHFMSSKNINGSLCMSAPGLSWLGVDDYSQSQYSTVSFWGGGGREGGMGLSYINTNN